MRNSSMKDGLSKALKTSPGGLHAERQPSQAELSRRENLRKRFSRKHALPASKNDPIVPVEEPVTMAAVAVMEPPAAEPEPTEPTVEPTEHDPSPAEVDRFIESFQTTVNMAPQQVVQQPALPPDLAFLELDAPFNSYLRGIVGHLRDAKTRVNFTLSNCLTREKAFQAQFEKAQADLLNEQVQIETLKSQLHKLDESISSCALLSEQSLEVAPLIYQSHTHAKPTKPVHVEGERRKYMRPSADDPTICRRADVLKFFEANPTMNWSLRELKGQMPLHKQAHAKKVIAVVCAELTVAGKLVRMTEGVYRLKQ